MKYDDSEFYFLNFETDLSNEAGATHIGMYMTWLILGGLASDELNEHRGDIEASKKTAREILLDQCDGKLMDEDLSATGKDFTRSYYERHYINDYLAVFAVTQDSPDALCAVEASWENYRKLAPKLAARFSAWKKANALSIADSSESAKPLPDRFGLLDMLQVALEPFFTKHRFKIGAEDQWFKSRVSQSRIFEAPFAGGTHRIELHGLDQKPHLEFEVTVESRLDELAFARYVHVRGEAPTAGKKLAFTTRLVQKNWLGAEYGLEPGEYRDYRYTIRTVRDIEPCFAHFCHHMDTRLPGILRQFETVQGMDALLNTNPISNSILFDGYFHMAHLLSAQMANNPRLEALCDEMQENIEKADPRWWAKDIPVMLEHIAKIRAAIGKN